MRTVTADDVLNLIFRWGQERYAAGREVYRDEAAAVAATGRADELLNEIEKTVNAAVNPGHRMEIHYDDEAGALYVDGKLHGDAGDAYRAREQALGLLGVTTVHDSRFMLDSNDYARAARTTDEIAAFVQRKSRAGQVAALRQKAEELRCTIRGVEAVFPGEVTGLLNLIAALDLEADKLEGNVPA